MLFILTNLSNSINTVPRCIVLKNKILLNFIHMKIAIINGPNLNLVGRREPGIYGSKSFDEFFEEIKAAFTQVEFTYFQSNIEGELIDKIQALGFTTMVLL